MSGEAGLRAEPLAVMSGTGVAVGKRLERFGAQRHFLQTKGSEADLRAELIAARQKNLKMSRNA